MLRPRGMPGVNTGGGQYYYFLLFKNQFRQSEYRQRPLRTSPTPSPASDSARRRPRSAHTSPTTTTEYMDTQNYLFETRKSTFVFSPFCFQTCFSYSNCLEFSEGSCSDCISGEADCIDQEDVGETHTLLAGIDSILKN